MYHWTEDRKRAALKIALPVLFFSVLLTLLCM